MEPSCRIAAAFLIFAAILTAAGQTPAQSGGSYPFGYGPLQPCSGPVGGFAAQIPVPGGANVLDVNVTLQINTPSAAALVIALSDGVNNVLLTDGIPGLIHQVGASGIYTFDDQAPMSWDQAVASTPQSGSVPQGAYRPDGVLSGLNGPISNPVWNFAACSDWGGDIPSGTLHLVFATAGNPAPVIHSISPPAAVTGDPLLNLVVTGSGFSAAAAVLLDQAPLPTTYVSATQLQAQVSASMLAQPGRREIQIQTGGGVSDIRRLVVARAHSIEVLSVDDNGIAADAESIEPAASLDARFVAFASRAGNLVPGIGGGIAQIYVYDRADRLIRCVSLNTSGAAADGDCARPSLSSTGRYLLFSSRASILAAGTGGGIEQVYRVDRDTDNDGLFDEPGATATNLVSAGPGGVAANADCRTTAMSLSENGAKAVFESAASNLALSPAGGGLNQIWVRNIATGQTFLASASSAGIAGNGPSFAPAISGSGSFVAFHTEASNLFAGDLNGASDVVRKSINSNTATGTVTLASRASGAAGAQSDGGSSRAVISRTGQWVSFQSDATNFAANDQNGLSDVYRRDFNTGTTLLVSYGVSGNAGLGASYTPAISPTGCTIYVSDAGDLAPGDHNLLPDVYAWNSATPASPPVPVSMYEYPYGPMGAGTSGTTGVSMSTSASLVAFSTTAVSLAMSGTATLTAGTAAFVAATVAPFAPVPVAGPDDNPVSFSVNGPVDPQTEGLLSARGGGLPGPYTTRTPAVPKAVGAPTFRPGDVNDYFLSPVPSEAELFQSEPDFAPAAPPSGTDNQIVVAAESGLVAGMPFAPARDNLNALSFGEDYFGVRGVTPAPPTGAVPWQSRSGVFPEPVVTIDIGTSFRFGVDPWAVGLPPTDVALESGSVDAGAGSGPWTSPFDAAGDVFGTPVLMKPGPPAPGINTLVHDNPLLALAPPGAPTPVMEDDLDALECVGENDPGTWAPGLAGPTQPGNLRSRVTAIIPGLGPPGMAHAVVTPAPVFISVDRNSTGEPLSAVRTQYLAGEAAADVFLVLGGTNYLFIDETEMGLFPGAPSVPGGGLTDDLDALVLKVHPQDRPLVLALAAQALAQSSVANPGTAMERRIGPGFSYSLLRFAYLMGTPLRVRVGFSVTTDSVGLMGSAVDYEAGVGPIMEHSGDIFFTQFGTWADAPAILNPAPALPLGVHWLWYEEVEIGLDPGAWTLPAPAGRSLALLPDELNALDTLCSQPYCPGLIMSYGSPCAGTGGFAPVMSAQGWASPGSPIAFSIHNAMGASTAYIIAATAAGSAPIPGIPASWPFYFDPNTIVAVVPLPLSGSAPGEGKLLVAGRFDPATPPMTLVLQAFILDSGGMAPGFSSTNAVVVSIP